MRRQAPSVAAGTGRTGLETSDGAFSLVSGLFGDATIMLTKLAAWQLGLDSTSCSRKKEREDSSIES